LIIWQKVKTDTLSKKRGKSNTILKRILVHLKCHTFGILSHKIFKYPFPILSIIYILI
jgi:hypothetical protein